MSRQIPILYSTPMVQALIAKTKTMTRRTKYLDTLVIDQESGYVFFNEEIALDIHTWKRDILQYCPYGKVGDVLWVREEHFRFGRWFKNGRTKSDKQKWTFEPLDLENRYIDTMKVAYLKSMLKSNPSSPYWYKRLARFMPKSACRIWLEITDVRVERLLDITEEDAIAEGIERIESGFKNYLNAPKILESLKVWDNAKMSFLSLWESINGVESSTKNPWVWVISFKQIEKP